MKNSMRYILGLLFLLIMDACGLCFCSALAASPPLNKTIAIIQPQHVTAYQQAIQSFLATLRRKNRIGINTLIYDTPETLYKSLGQAEPPHIDLLVTVGTAATAEVSRKIFDIPIVFSMVLDPEKILQHRNDVVGASLNIPLELRLNMIKEILPSAKKIGIIYDPKSNTELVRSITALAPQFDLDIKQFPVASQKEIPQALSDVKKRTDVLLGIVDNTVYTSRTTAFIIRSTVKTHFPFIGISSSYVKAGALCALVFDNADIGRQTAQLAQHVLAGTAPLHNTTPGKIGLALNLRTAEIIGVTIPKKIQRKATIVYK